MAIRKKEELIKSSLKFKVNQGFSQVPDSITMCYDLTTDEKAMYLLLLKNFNDKAGYAFPSWEYMKIILNRGDGKINQTLQGLEKKGLIIREKLKGKRNKYLLNSFNVVPCIALSEATFYFKQKAADVGLQIWDIIREVIKSVEYKAYRDNFKEGTVIDYLNYLQNLVEGIVGVKVSLPEVQKQPLGIKLPF